MYQYPEDFEQPACDLCGSGPIHRRVLIPKANGTECTLVECTVCGLRFFSPRPKWEIVGPLVAEENEQAQRLFDNCSFFPVADPAEQKAMIRNYYRRMLEDCTRIYGRIPQTMLEIGGNVGWFAKAASEFGVKEIDGVDLNPYAVHLAVTGHGIPHYIGMACDFADFTPVRQYAMIVALDYMEHTYRPWQDLVKMASVLEPGGVLLLKTFVDELDTKHEMLAPPSHAIHWTTPVLRGAIERAGLTVKDWRVDYGFMPIIIANKEITP